MKTTSLFLALVLLSASSFSKQNSDIVVAILDTGVDTHHPTVSNRLWINTGESGTDSKGHDKMTNGIDDDGNGFIDDVYGWNFVSNNKNISDEQGHGTHIAGLISEGKKTRVMILKVFDSRATGLDSVQSTARAIRYAVQMGAQIINYSGGGPQAFPEEKNALEFAEKNQVLFVAAAGNEHQNSDLHPFFPADYGTKNILSVAAVDLFGTLLPSSNFGMKSVHIAAPGERILSSLPANQFGMMTGTSQATALVTRAAALIMSQKVQSPSNIIQKLIKTGDPIPQLRGKIKNPVVLNALRATSID